jgi:hypothetical protein
MARLDSAAPSSSLRCGGITAPEAVAYGLADEVIGDPAGAPESGTPA